MTENNKTKYLIVIESNLDDGSVPEVLFECDTIEDAKYEAKRISALIEPQQSAFVVKYCHSNTIEW